MSTAILIPSQNEGLLPVLFGSNNMKKEESTYTPYEVVNEHHASRYATFKE